MTLLPADVTVVHVGVALVLGLLAGAVLALRARRRRATPRRDVARILLPFTGGSISRRALDSAFRVAKAEGATLVPAYLATVPLRMDLEAPLPLQCEGALPLLDAIEQRGQRYEVQVDSRIERGRTARDALQRLLCEESFDRLVVPASSPTEAGFSSADVAWMLEHVDAEVLVIRAGAGQDQPVPGAYV